jgi:hypothetical protein
MVKRYAACGGAIAASISLASAQEPSDGTRPVVVEMFLSQSCKASPPAAEYLAELAERRDVVALAWHVDYYDHVPARKVGPWADPFAHPAFVMRQKIYNERIRGNEMGFTPQAIVDGFVSVVGSNRVAVEHRVTEARFYEEKAYAASPQLDLDREDQDDGKRDLIRVRIDGVASPYDAYAVAFRKTATTSIAGGDNAGVTMREANVVRGVRVLARNVVGAGEFSFTAPHEGLDCAVIVHERNQGRIVAARYCGD